jgi:hypothetical protein
MLRTFILAAAAALSLSTPAHARWYIGHWGASDCLPLDDVDWAHPGQRLYGAGSVTTPEQAIAPFVAHGFTVEALPPTPAFKGRIEAFKMHAPDDEDGFLIFFSELNLCKRVLSAIQSER